MMASRPRDSRGRFIAAPRVTGHFEWNDQGFRLFLDEAFVESASKIAAQCLGQAVVNIRRNDQIDTGAMINSQYVILPRRKESGFDEARARATHFAGVGGKSVTFFDEPQPDRDTLAIIGFAVHYALYQEAVQPFFFPAVDSVMRRMGANLIAETARSAMVKVRPMAR